MSGSSGSSNLAALRNAAKHSAHPSLNPCSPELHPPPGSEEDTSSSPASPPRFSHPWMSHCPPIQGIMALEWLFPMIIPLDKFCSTASREDSATEQTEGRQFPDHQPREIPAALLNRERRPGILGERQCWHWQSQKREYHRPQTSPGMSSSDYCAQPGSPWKPVGLPC